MKIREGFVSNSSSTSFCIYGAYVENSKIRKAFNMEDDADIYDIVYEKIEGKGELDVTFSPYDSGVYIGIPWYKVDDNETGIQFKKRVQKAFDDVGLKGLSLETHQESWYDG